MMGGFITVKAFARGLATLLAFLLLMGITTAKPLKQSLTKSAW